MCLSPQNKCNVGYAFMNFFDAKMVASFYERYSGQRWSKFNSEKVCQVSYARIQGRVRLSFLVFF